MQRPLIALLVLVSAVLIAPAPAQAHGPAPRPVVFVHGSAGSGNQFQTQAKRLAANGYPLERIEAHEYDSTFATTTLAEVWAGLDVRITRLLAETGADAVDLLGHSLGTFVAQGYLASAPERAARVAHYVNLDGRTATAPPGGVPTLAVWGEGDPARTITGATNVSFPDQAHTQVVTSASTFRAVYRFFTGRAPRTTALVPQHRIEVSGRAVLFPTNVGAGGTTLEVYEVGPLTGTRLRQVARYTIGPDGAFGPFRGRGGARYEFALLRPGAAVHHFYSEPLMRSDRLVRLLTGLPGEGIGAIPETSDRHVNLTVSRNLEWWGGVDHLYVDGTDVLNEANAPRTKRVIGAFLYDRHTDGVTDLSAPLPEFFATPFITGMDVYLPARGVVSLVAARRTGGVAFVNTPAWPSTGHRSTVLFNDF